MWTSVGTQLDLRIYLFTKQRKKCNSRSLDKREREDFSNIFDISNIFDLFDHHIFLNNPLG